MDKLAYYRIHGQRLALERYAESALDDLAKTASEGGSVEREKLAALSNISDNLDYIAAREKVARFEGIGDFAEGILGAIEAGYSGEHIVASVKQAMEEADAALADVEPDVEDSAEVSEAAIDGAAEALSTVVNVPADSPALQELAAEVVGAE